MLPLRDVKGLVMCNVMRIQWFISIIIPWFKAYSHQPAFESDGIHVELLHQPQVMVHVLQTTQHLQPQSERKTICSTATAFDRAVTMHVLNCRSSQQG